MTERRLQPWTPADDERLRKLSAHDLDRIIVRLPPGMREKLGERAVENGRSMTAEVVAALTEHLRRKDRLSALEGQLEAMQGNIDRVWDLVAKFAKTLDEKTNTPSG
jgi:plasmid stability protein